VPASFAGAPAAPHLFFAPLLPLACFDGGAESVPGCVRPAGSGLP